MLENEEIPEGSHPEESNSVLLTPKDAARGSVTQVQESVAPSSPSDDSGSPTETKGSDNRSDLQIMLAEMRKMEQRLDKKLDSFRNAIEKVEPLHKAVNDSEKGLLVKMDRVEKTLFSP
jgi:hypothetical protein